MREFPHAFPSPLVHRCVLTYVCARLGDATAANTVMEELIRRDLADWHLDSEWLFSITLLAEAGAILGNRDHAAVLYDLLLPYRSLNAVAPIEAALGSASRALGMLATVLGRFDDAASHYDHALQMNANMGARPWVAHTGTTTHGCSQLAASPASASAHTSSPVAHASTIATSIWTLSRSKRRNSSAP